MGPISERLLANLARVQAVVYCEVGYKAAATREGFLTLVAFMGLIGMGECMPLEGSPLREAHAALVAGVRLHGRMGYEVRA